MLNKNNRSLSSSSSSGTEDGHNGETRWTSSCLGKVVRLVYIETLLYIVHVDEDTSAPLKRTTASFNERHRRAFSFTNPLRRLNSKRERSGEQVTGEHCLGLLKRDGRRTSEVNNNHREEEEEEETFPPPPSFIDDPMNIQATGPGLLDGLAKEQCQFDLNAPHAELQKLVIAIDGPSKAEIQIEAIETGVYRVFYTCQSPGQ